ncbi:spore coat protein YsxE [Gracilibacillus halotolerans]|uniref:Spore coat protein YsxE n=1 Tax=Gracilibacillus halotolerans TaxID=74386 RepID=A0A841RIZ6_9BACI|nr:phosphotransferase [Gracilibacillus halotolerans]MBB6511972.1 spore coat protein YsxE [Gracilibacillus halotolerans]
MLFSSAITTILSTYGITDYHQEKRTERVYRIQTNTGSYALKKSHVNNQTIGKWQAVYQWVVQQQVDAFLPIMPNQNQQLLVLHENEYYYLTPWIENETVDMHPAFFHAIGKLHGSTLQKKDFVLDNGKRQTIEESLLEELEFYRGHMNVYVEQIEKKRFMSPLELQIVMNYRYLIKLFDITEYWQAMYVEALEEETTWSSCLVHGSLTPEHLIVNDFYQYFLNWESTYIGSPVDDLYTLCRNMFKNHDCSMDKVMEGFQIYENYVTFSRVEKCSLILRLIDIRQLFTLVQEIMDQPVEKKRIPLSIETEREWRRIILSLQLQEILRSQIEAEEAETD